jgi:GT2 family glycosyltransferase
MRLSLVLSVHTVPPAALQRTLRALRGQELDDVVVVMDRTPAEQMEMLRDELPEATICHLDGSPGWRSACTAWNMGARAADGDLLFFLPSDIMLGPGTLQAARRLQEEHPCVIWPSVSEEKPEQAKQDGLTLPVHSSSIQPRPMTYCLCVPRQAFLEVGGYDVAFEAGWGNDDRDLAHRLWGAGLPFVFDDTIWGIHQTHDRPHVSAEKVQINRELFAQRWGEVLAPIKGIGLQRPIGGMLVWTHAKPGRGIEVIA